MTNQIPMTNERMTMESRTPLRHWVIEHSSLLRHSSFVIRYSLHLLILVAIFLSTSASAAPITATLPYDTIGFIELDPAPMAVSSDRKGRGEFFDLGVQAMSSLGVMPREAAAVTDLLRLAGQVGQRHNVLAWVDADFAVNYDTGELNGHLPQLVWVVDVGGQPDQFLQLLSSVLSDYSTPQTVHQSVQSSGADKYVEFYDDAWPAWLRLYWIQQGDNLVITLGPGSMPHYLMRSAKHVPWDATIEKVDRQLQKENAAGQDGALVIRGWLSIRQLRQRWPDVMTMTVASRLLRAFDLRYADEAVLTGTLKDREFSVSYATLEGKSLTLTPWTAHLPADAPLRKMVPDDATFFMIFNFDWQALYVRIVNVSDIAAEEHEDKGIKDALRQYGVDVKDDIVDGLSPLVLVHDSPRHPLRLPGMMTVIAAAKPGAAQRVQMAANNLIGQATRVLDHRAGVDGDPWRNDDQGDAPSARRPGKWAHLQIRRDPDGVSYFQYGLAGPAWEWLDRRFVFSWSPTAVRAVADGVKRFPPSPDCFAAPK
jgi:hypothetical protein